MKKQSRKLTDKENRVRSDSDDEVSCLSADFELITRVQSAVILERLYRRDLDWVLSKFPLEESPQNFLIGGSSRVDAYLILWKEWPGLFKMSDLKGGKNLIRRLADSWLHLQEDYKEPVYVHLVTNELASTAKLRGTPAPNFHLANFLASEWKRAPETDSYGEWSSVWKQFEKASNLEEAKFNLFVKRCRFDLQYPLPVLDEDLGPEQPYERVELIRKALFQGGLEHIHLGLEEIEKLVEKQTEELNQEQTEEQSQTQEQTQTGEQTEEQDNSLAEDMETEETVLTESQSTLDSASDLDLAVASANEAEPQVAEPRAAELPGVYLRAKTACLDSGSLDQTMLEDSSGHSNQLVNDDPKPMSSPADDEAEAIEPASVKVHALFEDEDQDSEDDDDYSNSSLDFAPDVKSGNDVRESQSTEIAKLNNFDKIIRLSHKHAGRDDVSLKVMEDAFEWYFNNANELFENKRYQDAERDYRHALEKLVQLNIPKTEEEYQLLDNLGEIYIYLDRPDLAVELYERTEEMRVSSKIPIPKYVNALLTNGGSYEEKGYIFDAEPFYRKAVEVSGNYLEVHDPLVKRANDALLRLTREKTSLVARFSPGELDRLKERQDKEKAIMHRKPKITKGDEANALPKDIWKTREDQAQLPGKKDVSNFKWWLLSIVPIAFLAFIVVFNYPTMKSGVGHSSSASNPSRVYRSVDGLDIVSLDSDGMMKLSQFGSHRVGTYKIVGDGFSDLLSLLPGHLRRSNQFLRLEEPDVLSYQGTKYYPKDSPESEMAQYMWRYAKLAQLYRNEHRVYPDSLRQLVSANGQTTYINPFTKKQEQAEIVYALGSNDLGLPQRIGEGESWKGQPTSSPGAIVCNNFEGSRFFVRGYDRNGEFLSSAVRGSCFFIELSYGDNITEDKIKEIERKATHKTSRENTRFVLVRGDTDFGKSFTMADALVPTLIAVMTIGQALVWRYRFKKGQSGFMNAVLFTLSFISLIVWYLIAFLDV